MTDLGWPGVEPLLGGSGQARPLSKRVILSGFSAALLPRSRLSIPTVSDPSVTKCDTDGPSYPLNRSAACHSRYSLAGRASSDRGSLITVPSRA